jgi:hypothetical protein
MPKFYPSVPLPGEAFALLIGHFGFRRPKGEKFGVWKSVRYTYNQLMSVNNNYTPLIAQIGDIAVYKALLGPGYRLNGGTGLAI